MLDVTLLIRKELSKVADFLYNYYGSPGQWSEKQLSAFSLSLAWNIITVKFLKFSVQRFVLSALEDDVIEGVDGSGNWQKRFRIVNSLILSILGMLFMKENKAFQRLSVVYLNKKRWKNFQRFY